MRSGLNTIAAVVLLWAVALPGQAASLAEKVIQRQLSEAYATTILLADGEAIQLGLVNFNPNDIAELDDDKLGTEESISGRERLSLLSVPLELEVPVSLYEHDVHAGLRFSMLREVERGKLATSLDPDEDRFETRVYSVEGHLRWRYHMTNNWSLDLGEALYLMRYENRTEFRNADSRDLRPGLDGLVTNYASNAWVSRTTTGLVWTSPQTDTHTEYFSTLNYLAGDTIDPAESEHNAEPEAWYWRNGVRAKVAVFGNNLASRFMLLKLSRVNVGGDLRNPMGSSVFYEAGVGFVSSTNGRIPFLRNLGLFLNLNYGSDLRGGTLGLLYNVD